MSERPSARLVAAIATALFLAGCTVGPDHVRPDSVLPERFAGADAVTSAPPQDATGTRDVATATRAFWTRFEDPLLTSLVDEALSANHDLRVALARLDEARALARLARFDLAPSATLVASTGERRASTDEARGVPRGDRDTERHAVGLAIGWELDLFGRIRRGTEASHADAGAARADLEAMQVAVAADVARTYFQLRGFQDQLAAGRAGADLQQGSLDLVEARFEAGRGTTLDTARAALELASTQARLPVLEAEVAAAAHRLAVLTGRAPDALRSAVAAPVAIPDISDVDPGTPGDLLRRRPDIAAAEHRLEAATARIGVATADLFPRFTLGALLGTEAAAASDLFGRDSESGFVALGIDWAFLDVGRVRARIAAADASAEGELARYEQTVLRALEDTETALARHAGARAERERLEVAAAAGAEAARVARLRFEGGLVDFLDVIDAERARVLTDDLLAQSRARAATAVVDVHRAIGGGWPERMPERVPLATR